MSEWLKEPVLKTGDVEASVGSNPTLSATGRSAHVRPSSTKALLFMDFPIGRDQPWPSLAITDMA